MSTKSGRHDANLVRALPMALERKGFAAMHCSDLSLDIEQRPRVS